MDRPNITHCSKQVQAYIAELERTVRRQRARIVEMTNVDGEDADGSNVSVQSVDVGDEDTLLPRDSQIVFRVEDTDGTTGRIYVGHERDRRDRRYLRVQADNSLHVIPSASNSFKIVFGDYQ